MKTSIYITLKNKICSLRTEMFETVFCLAKLRVDMLFLLLFIFRKDETKKVCAVSKKFISGLKNIYGGIWGPKMVLKQS